MFNIVYDFHSLFNDCVPHMFFCFLMIYNDFHRFSIVFQRCSVFQGFLVISVDCPMCFYFLRLSFLIMIFPIDCLVLSMIFNYHRFSIVVRWFSIISNDFLFFNDFQWFSLIFKCFLNLFIFVNLFNDFWRNTSRRWNIVPILSSDRANRRHTCGKRFLPASCSLCYPPPGRVGGSGGDNRSDPPR